MDIRQAGAQLRAAQEAEASANRGEHFQYAQFVLNIVTFYHNVRDADTKTANEKRLSVTADAVVKQAEQYLLGWLNKISGKNE